MMAEEHIGKFTAYNIEGRAALADENGAILYTYENDLPLRSVCAGQCAHDWPPATAVDADVDFQDFAIIIRHNGARQWTHKGRPLYRSAVDPGQGQSTAIGTDGLWYPVRVQAHHM